MASVAQLLFNSEFVKFKTNFYRYNAYAWLFAGLFNLQYTATNNKFLVNSVRWIHLLTAWTAHECNDIKISPVRALTVDF